MFKFTEAFSKTDNSLISIFELNNLRRADFKIFEQKYTDELLCPECLKVPLQYVHAVTPYLRTLQDQPHADGCSLQQNLISPSDFDNYCNETKNFDKIHNRLENILQQLLILKKIQLARNPFTMDVIGKSKLTPTSSSGGTCVALPRHKITIPLCDEDYDTKKIYYGTVGLEWSAKSIDENWSLITLNVRSPKTNQFLCSLKMTRSVYDFIVRDVPISDIPVTYHLVFLTALELHNKRFAIGFIRHSSFFAVQKV